MKKNRSIQIVLSIVFFLLLCTCSTGFANSIKTNNIKTGVVKKPTSIKPPDTKFSNTKSGHVPTVTIRSERFYLSNENINFSIVVNWPENCTLIHGLQGRNMVSSSVRPRGRTGIIKVPLGLLQPGSYDYMASVQYGNQTTRRVLKRIYVKAPIRVNLTGPSQISGYRGEEKTFTLVAHTTAPRDRRYYAEFYDMRQRSIGREMFGAGDSVTHQVTTQLPGDGRRVYYARVFDRDNLSSPMDSYYIQFRDTGRPRVTSFGLPNRPISMRSGIAQMGFTIRAESRSFELAGYEIEWRPFLTTSGELGSHQVSFNGSKRLEGMSPATWRPKVRVRDTQNRWSAWLQGAEVELVESGAPALIGAIDAPGRVYRVQDGLNFRYNVSIGGGTISEYKVRWNRGELFRSRANTDNINREMIFRQPMPNFNTITLTLSAKHGPQWIDLDSKDIEVVPTEQTIGVTASTYPETASKTRYTHIIFRMQLRTNQPPLRFEYSIGHTGGAWQRLPLSGNRQYAELSIPIGDAAPGTYSFGLVGVDTDGQRSDVDRVRYVITP